MEVSKPGFFKKLGGVLESKVPRLDPALLFGTIPGALNPKNLNELKIGSLKVGESESSSG